jgi:hypothetical protein
VLWISIFGNILTVWYFMFFILFIWLVHCVLQWIFCQNRKQLFKFIWSHFHIPINFEWIILCQINILSKQLFTISRSYHHKQCLCRYLDSMYFTSVGKKMEISLNVHEKNIKFSAQDGFLE